VFNFRLFHYNVTTPGKPFTHMCHVTNQCNLYSWGGGWEGNPQALRTVITAYCGCIGLERFEDDVLYLLHFTYAGTRERAVWRTDADCCVRVAVSCYPACQHGGRCTSPNQCICPPGYTGSYCQLGPCLHLLSTHADRKGVDISFAVFCLFVCMCVLCVCTVTDFSAEDKASGVEFCTVVYRHPGHKFLILGNFASPEAQKRSNRTPQGSIA